MRLTRCLALTFLLTALFAAPAMAQTAGLRTRDRQPRSRTNTNDTGNRTRNNRSTGQFPAKNLPAEFAVLRTRSIFSRDRMAARSADATPRDIRPQTQNRPSSPIFRGVLSENGTPLAGIERGTSSITWYRQGQALQNGEKITLISLDQIIITQRNGNRRSIIVGERLDEGTAVAREPGFVAATTQPASDPRFTLRDDDDSTE